MRRGKKWGNNMLVSIRVSIWILVKFLLDFDL